MGLLSGTISNDPTTPARMTAATRVIMMIADVAGEDEDDTTTTAEVEGTMTVIVIMIEATVTGIGIVVMEVDVIMIEDVATMIEDIKRSSERSEKLICGWLVGKVPALCFEYDIFLSPVLCFISLLLLNAPNILCMLMFLLSAKLEEINLSQCINIIHILPLPVFTMYRIFLGAPTTADIHRDPASYQWQTISPNESKPRKAISATQSAIFPPATLEAASHRISLMYQNIIFDDTLDEQEYTKDIEDGDQGRGEQTTLYTWLPTAEDSGRQDNTAPSFLLDISKSHQVQTQFETQVTQETQSYGNYSDASSIARFPSFHFNLHFLTSLSTLSTLGASGSRRVSVLLAALEVEGPDTIRIKKGADAGKEVSLLKMILGDEDGNVCKLTAWREVAEAWGGEGATPALKRGDIIFIENVMATWDAVTSPTLTASPYMKSKADICYRTMPYTYEDSRLRPDLRLGESDAAVRKVAGLVRWFEGMAGLVGAAL
ncbi:hypothetical protein BDZ94DRAFT_768125 [Collybia nuda]|uniref:Uncharacterized protein n=1 Tax=Collybia nuda TaxID=64659 RepID=A0A9P5Y262_9AGAR|nr:hypothetical protein BDZ94DRAFT_768125 [Collybia nuda]